MDVIAAAFDETTEATSAARDLEAQLHIGGDSITVDPVSDPSAGSGAAQPVPGAAVLVAYVQETFAPAPET